jgi:predicted AAA+ superfamily ATPase
LNDVGLLTGILYGNNVRPVLNDMRSINLGSVYENVVAQELASHGYKLFYYDNRSKGEVDFLIDDHNTISVLPVEVKSGKDYTKHSALDNFMKVPDYHVSSAMVLNDDREIKVVNNVTYAPVYNVMFLSAKEQDPEDLIF